VGQSKSSKYYAANPKAKAKKNAYQKKFNARPENIESRSQDNSARAKLKLKKGDKRDASRTVRRVNGKLVVTWKAEDRSKNRGSKSNSPGDKRARGKKRK
jgi:hypothetical protein